MKITIDSKSFVDAVMWVTKSYDAKDDRAYVGFFINADGEGVLSHANNNSYMKSNYTVVSVDFEGDDVTEASFALEGIYLKNLASAIGSTSTDFTISKKLKKERTSLEVKTGVGRFTIPLLDYRVAKAPEYVEIGEVDDNEFFDSLTRIAKLCDSDNSGSSSFIGSVDLGFDVENESLKMFATDRYAMGEIALGFSPSNNEDDTVEEITSKHILLPSSSANLIPATKGVNTSITLITENGGDGTMRFGYSFPDSRVALFSLVNAATFSHIEAMKSKALKEVEHSITVPTTALKNTIRTISSLSPSEDDVYFTIDGDGLVVTDSSKSNSLEVEHSELDYDKIDEEYRARFVRAVINEAFSPISTSSVKLKWGANSMAFVLEPITEDGATVDNVFVMAVLGKLD